MRHFGKIGWLFFACMQVCLAMPMQSYVVCSPQKSPAIIKKWAKNIELELELIDNVLIKKCVQEAQRQGQIKEVEGLIEIVTKAVDGKEHAQIRVYAKKQLLLQRDIAEADLTSQNATRFVKEVRERIESVQANGVVREAEAGIQIFSEINRVKGVSVATEGEELGWHDKSRQLIPKTPENILKIEKHRWFVSTRLGGENFGYQFVPKDIEEIIPAIWTKMYPRLGAGAEWWPYPWIGINTNGSLALSVFRMEVKDLNLFESEKIWARHYQGEIALKIRHYFSGDFALGLSTGYWYQAGVVDLQKVGKKIYTQLPSFQLHAWEIGGELYFESSQKKIDIALLICALPFVFYQESPDAPGHDSSTFGLHAQFLFRYFFASNWFFAFELKGIGLYSMFHGSGDRITIREETFQGGVSLNYMLTTSLGIGWAL